MDCVKRNAPRGDCPNKCTIGIGLRSEVLGGLTPFRHSNRLSLLTER